MRDGQFFARLERHMQVEEKRVEEDAAKFAQIEKDLRPLRHMYWAVAGSGGVAALLMALLIWVYNEDRGSVKMMQERLYDQGTAIQLLLKVQSRIERDVDRLNGRHGP